MKTFCGKVLLAYMNPDVFVYVDKLPRTSTDKVDYRACCGCIREPHEHGFAKRRR